MTSKRLERDAAKGAVPNAEFPLACRRGVGVGAARERLLDGWRAKPDLGPNNASKANDGCGSGREPQAGCQPRGGGQPFRKREAGSEPSR